MDQITISKENKFNNPFADNLLRAIFFIVIFSLSLLSTITAYGASNLWDGSTASGFAGGTGTEADPYLISTGEQLAFLSQQVNKASGNITYEGKYIKLTQDILLNEMNPDGTFKSGSPRQFPSIGSPSKPFVGVFDGGGFEIIGLYVNSGWHEYRGLFGYAGTGSVIKDLRVSGSIYGTQRTGSIAGYTDGTIIGCVVSSKVTPAGGVDYHGGIAGYAGVNSIISNCTASGTVEGQNNVGGIVGYTEGKITACNSNNAVTGVSKVGGIAGYAAGTGAEISDCEFSGTAYGNSECIGGIAGKTEGLITGCYVNATIEGSSGTVGGVAGEATGAFSTISNCTISGTVKAIGGYGYVGGVAGKADGKITGCTCECSVTGNGQHYVGGIVGSAGTDSEVSNSSSSGNIAGINKVGGIAGYTDGEIKICINTGNVNGSSGHTGGVAGETGNNSSVSNSFNSGAIYGGGQGSTGGIVGHVSSGSIVHHNLNKGTIDGANPKGSVIGNAIDEDNAWNNYYYDYEGAPGGTNSGDILDDDGAVPIGDLTWDEIQELLNGNNNPDGDDVWNPDLDDDGVPKPGSGSSFKVLHSVIKEGRHFSAALLGSGTTTTVTSESVFTVFFRLGYDISCNPEDQTLILKNNNDEVMPFPVGTSIIMLAGDSYYYINLTVSAASIKLGDFIKMGSTVEHYISLPAVEGEVKEYLFIFDFSKIATENQIPGGAYSMELTTPNGGYSGTLPVITVTGKNSYDFSVNAAADMFTINFNKIPVPGYDYKTDGKIFAYEFYLENQSGTEKIPLPVGTKVNGTCISAILPYTLVPASFGDTTITLDMSECVHPIPQGTYALKVTTYACGDILNPRNGYVLANDTANITLSEPIIYAIKAKVNTKVFDRSSSPIPVDFTIQTLPLGSNNIKPTLQRKYGTVYVNKGEVDFTIDEGRVTLYLPEKSPKGTYRFILTLFDGSGTAKAEAAQNVIIK